MACPVESISPDFVVLIVMIGNCIHICFFRHGLVEGGIKYAYHRNSGHQGFTGFYADNIGGVMERSQLTAFLNGLLNLSSNQCGFCEMFASVHKPVPYRSYFLKALYHSRFLIGQCLQYQADSLFMILHRSFCNLFFTSCRSINQTTSFNRYSFAQSLCDQLLALCINQLEF